MGKTNLKKYYADREKIMAEARSLHWTAQQLSKSLNGTDIARSHSYIAPLGYLLSSAILQALAAETALKALQMLKLGYFIKGHDLLKLFEQLQPDMRQGIDIVYQLLVQYVNEKNPVAIIPEGSIEDVLRKHNHDFEEWRYFYELNDGANLSFPDLRWATQAMVINFDVLSIDASSPNANADLVNRLQGIVDTQ